MIIVHIRGGKRLIGSIDYGSHIPCDSGGLTFEGVCRRPRIMNLRLVGVRVALVVRESWNRCRSGIPQVTIIWNIVLIETRHSVDPLAGEPCYTVLYFVPSLERSLNSDPNPV